MTVMIEELLVCLKNRGWKIETNKKNDGVLPDEISSRYKNML